MKLRSELILLDALDGGLDVIDLLLEREHHFVADDALSLRGGGDLPPPLAARLAQAMLLEGPVAKALREGCRHGRMRSHAPAPAFAASGSANVPWDEARSLPEWVATPWRDPERWRRLAEDRIAQRTLLRIDGFLTEPHALELRRTVAALPFHSQDNMYVRGDGYDIKTELDAFFDSFRSGPLHRLISYVMNESLPSRLFLRAWRFGPGGRIGIHKDGLHYVTTFSIGLSCDWTAAAGGAIAFGQPVRAGLEVVERWLPHLGDLLLFRPSALAWHAVEEVAAGVRYTLTGQYVSADYPG